MGFIHILATFIHLMPFMFCVLSSFPMELNALCVWLCSLGHSFFCDCVYGLVCTVAQRYSKGEADNAEMPSWMSVQLWEGL